MIVMGSTSSAWVSPADPGDIHIDPGDIHIDPGDIHIDPGDIHVEFPKHGGARTSYPADIDLSPEGSVLQNHAFLFSCITLDS
jgi:hypothetical protein